MIPSRVLLWSLPFALWVWPLVADAALHYIRAGGTASTAGTGACNDGGSGGNWNTANACNDLPATLVRGDTYYVADGAYTSKTFNTAESGTTIITIKKATVADHGTATGWLDTYGDGQAVLGSSMTFLTDYYVVDGNGTHTVPSSNTNDYGFKIDSNTSTGTSGIVAIGNATNSAHYITIRYVHIFNATNGDINNGTVAIRWWPASSTYVSNYTKIQNCFVENSGKDGVQISQSSYILVERTYLKRLGKLLAQVPDNHGQTIQTFACLNSSSCFGGKNIIFRWNIWEANEGQALWSLAGDTDGLRFYGNLDFESTSGTPSTPGFNSSGGFFGDISGSPEPGPTSVYIYNNTHVNLPNYAGYKADVSVGDMHVINELWYNLAANNSQAGDFVTFGYHASGGAVAPGGTNAQTGLASTIFVDYANDSFRLASATNAGLDLTGQSWWSAGADSFFGSLDSAADMYGNTRGADGTWDRGAFEFVAGGGGSPSGVPHSRSRMRGRP